MDVMNENKTNEKVWKGRKPNPDYFPMKRCRKCGEVKPLDEFHKNPSMHDGHLHQCKQCQSRQMVEHWKTPEGKETLKRAQKRYGATAKGKFLRVKQSHKKRGGGKITMNVEQFEYLMENQESCAICGERFTKDNPPCTDHIKPIKGKSKRPSPLSQENIQLLCNYCSHAKWNKVLTPTDILAIKVNKMMKKRQQEAANE